MVVGGERGGPRVAVRRLVVAPGTDELVALRGERVGVGEVEQPLELGERLVVVLDPQLDGALPRLALGRHDDERGRLAPAGVAARAVARPDQNSSSWLPGARSLARR